MWGQMHEFKAVQDYIKLTGNIVKPVDVVLLPCGFLGCSPDGLIYIQEALYPSMLVFWKSSVLGNTVIIPLQRS